MQKMVASTKVLTPTQKKRFTILGVDVWDRDFIKIIPTDAPLPKAIKNAIITSQNAAKRVIAYGVQIDNLFCVGPQTEILLEQKYSGIREVCNTSRELSHIIVEKYASHEFVFFSGNISLDTIPKTLMANNIVCKKIEVYKTLKTPEKVEKHPDAIMFFSPSGVHSFLECNSIADTACICIGETTASVLKQNAKNIVVAGNASVDDVILATINFLNND